MCRCLTEGAATEDRANREAAPAKPGQARSARRADPSSLNPEVRYVTGQQTHAEYQRTQDSRKRRRANSEGEALIQKGEQMNATRKAKAKGEALPAKPKKAQPKSGCRCREGLAEVCTRQERCGAGTR